MNKRGEEEVWVAVGHQSSSIPGFTIGARAWGGPASSGRIQGARTTREQQSRPSTQKQNNRQNSSVSSFHNGRL